jgi:hypothetical protein
MISLASLWMPILLSAVIVFIVSSLVHTVFGYHAGDYAPLPNEDAALAALRGLNIVPGDYMVPRPSGMSGMKDPGFVAKLQQGPRVLMTVRAGGNTGMGAGLAQWFILSLVIGLFVAYLTSHTLPAGAQYLSVFRVAGVTAFLAYAMGHPSASIWYGRKWSTTIKHLFDGLIYGLLTGGVFGWLWPQAVS